MEEIKDKLQEMIIEGPIFDSEIDVNESNTEIPPSELSGNETINESLNDVNQTSEIEERKEQLDEVPMAESITENSAQTNDLSKIEENLVTLSEKFDEKIAIDAHKNLLFDKMYNELQSYKNDIYAKMLKPFILSTITLIDDTNSFLGKLDENESRKAEKYLRGIPDDLLDILEANGVELYEEESDVFNPKMQRALKSIPTDNPNLDKHIARRLRKGYSWNGSVLKPELVQIYKYEI